MHREKKIKLIEEKILVPKDFWVEGFIMEKIVRGDSNGSGRLYLPRRLIGKRVQVIIIPKPDELML